MGEAAGVRFVMTFPADEFPRLTQDDQRVTSPATPDCNCVALATEDTEHWWEPETFCVPGDSAEDDCDQSGELCSSGEYRMWAAQRIFCRCEFVSILTAK